MKYYIDIGNSELKIYQNNGDLLRIKNTKDNKVIEKMKNILIQNNYFIISSNDDQVKEKLEDYLMQRQINHHFFTNQDYAKLFKNYNVDVSNLGEDRALNMVAVQDNKDECIIIDFGTALTIDVITKSTYETGYIYPGIEIVKDGLVSGTSKIANFTMQPLYDGALLTTTSQINNAIILGYFGIINTCIDVISNIVNINNYEIILTGGSFNKIMDLTTKENFDKLFKYKYEKIDNLNYLGLKKIERELNL